MIPLRDEELVHPLLASYREKLFYAFAVAGALTLLPFAFKNLSQGRFVLAALTAVLVLLFIVNAVAIAYRYSPPIPLLLIALPTIAAIAPAVYEQGLSGVFWAYPAVLMFQFMFEPRTANVVNAVLIVLVVAASDPVVGAPLTIRVAISLVLTLTFSNIFAALARRLRHELETQVITDPLTGAYNRRDLARSLDEAVETRRRHGVTASLLAIDLDHFKAVNDRFGHHVGDLVLRNVVTAIRQRVRRLDIVFRTGGEEFLVLMPHTVLKRAALVADSLRAAITAGASHGDHRVTVSIGVAEVGPSEEGEQWMRRGDRALFKAKEAGRDIVALADAPPISVPTT